MIWWMPLRATMGSQPRKLSQDQVAQATGRDALQSILRFALLTVRCWRSVVTSEECTTITCCTLFVPFSVTCTTIPHSALKY